MDRSTFAALLTCLILAIAAPTLYIGGYFYLGEYYDTGRNYSMRTFPNDWLAAVYKPAGEVEGWLSGTLVEVDGP